MTQEQKDLLFKDLCARLPYGVKAYVKHWSNLDRKYYENVYTVKSTFPSLNEVHVQSETGSVNVILGYTDYVIKPYLFPLESMTEERKEEFDQLLELELKAISDEINHTQATEFEVDFYHKHHLDWRGLIPKGLAIDATNLNIY